jgi:hypothetical protein
MALIPEQMASRLVTGQQWTPPTVNAGGSIRPIRQAWWTDEKPHPAMRQMSEEQT